MKKREKLGDLIFFEEEKPVSVKDLRKAMVAFLALASFLPLARSGAANQKSVIFSLKLLVPFKKLWRNSIRNGPKLFWSFRGS